MKKSIKRNLCNEESTPLLQTKKYFKCNVCYKKLSSGDALIGHMRTHSGERPFKCTIVGCGMAFKLEATLKNHISYKHREGRPLKCKFAGCSYAAKAYETLYKHMKKHSDKRPYPCAAADCNYRAKWKINIVNHVKSLHSESKPFACPKCDYKAALNNSLKSHIIRRHSSRKYFKCSHPQCQQRFKTLQQLKSHFSNRHEERNLQCDRPSCGRKFATAKSLRHHKWVVHSTKNIFCPNANCCYRTNHSAKLSRHMIIHDGRNEKISFTIKGCQNKGKNSRAIRLHMRRHKNKIILARPVPADGQYFDGQVELPKLVKAFQCPLCFKYFASWHTLQSHFVVHTTEKPFKCGHCEYEAARLGDVKSHVSIVHANIKFPIILHLLDDRECLRCKVTLPSADFVVHCMSHAVPVVTLERMETRFPDSF